MGKFYTTSAQFYADMAESFYADYRLYKNEEHIVHQDPHDLTPQALATMSRIYKEIQKSAIASIIFQAFAIESYVNLFGICVVGEEEFYGKKLERKPVANKLSHICERINSSYPSEHLQKLTSFFDKRNMLVHQKPHCFSLSNNLIDNSEAYENYKQLSGYMDKVSYVLGNLENDMKLFKELKRNISILRGTDIDLIEEIRKPNRKD